MSKETETVKVTLELPKPVFDFYTALAESENKTIQNLLIEELTTDVEMILNGQEDRMKAIIIQLLGLEKILE